jgi:hypothetical protein
MLEEASDISDMYNPLSELELIFWIFFQNFFTLRVVLNKPNEKCCNIDMLG